MCDNLLVLLGPEKSEEGKPSYLSRKKIFKVILAQEMINLSWLVTTSPMGNSLSLSFKHIHTLSTWAVHTPARHVYYCAARHLLQLRHQMLQVWAMKSSALRGHCCNSPVSSPRRFIQFLDLTVTRTLSLKKKVSWKSCCLPFKKSPLNS